MLTQLHRIRAPGESEPLAWLAALLWIRSGACTRAVPMGARGVVGTAALLGVAPRDVARALAEGVRAGLWTHAHGRVTLSEGAGRARWSRAARAGRDPVTVVVGTAARPAGTLSARALAAAAAWGKGPSLTAARLGIGRTTAWVTTQNPQNPQNPREECLTEHYHIVPGTSTGEGTVTEGSPRDEDGGVLGKISANLAARMAVRAWHPGQRAGPLATDAAVGRPGPWAMLRAFAERPEVLRRWLRDGDAARAVELMLAICGFGDRSRSALVKCRDWLVSTFRRSAPTVMLAIAGQLAFQAVQGNVRSYGGCIRYRIGRACLGEKSTLTQGPIDMGAPDWIGHASQLARKALELSTSNA